MCFSQLFFCPELSEYHCNVFHKVLECPGDIFFPTSYTFLQLCKTSIVHLVDVENTLERFLRYPMEGTFIWWIYCLTYNRLQIDICLMNINLVFSDLNVNRIKGHIFFSKYMEVSQIYVLSPQKKTPDFFPSLFYQFLRKLMKLWKKY